MTSVLPPPPGSHGGDGARLARVLGVPPSEVLDLSASLNPVAPDVRSVVARHLDALERYPDPTDATDILAKAIAVLAEDVRTGWVEEPEFALYRRHLWRLDRDGPRWRSNPHNPSGLLAAPEETAGVWDEAFWQLATGTWTRGDADNGSAVVGSLTKLLACPGLRLGYLICPTEDMAARIRANQPQWSLNGLAASSLPELLETVDLPAWSRKVAELRAELEGLLRTAGLDPRPSDSNWLLVEAPGLRDELAARAILIRDCSSFGMPEVVRIAVPSPAGLERLEAALNSRPLEGQP